MDAANLSIDAFITSDWTMANPFRLCEFYGLPEPQTSGCRRVVASGGPSRRSDHGGNPSASPPTALGIVRFTRGLDQRNHFRQDPAATTGKRGCNSNPNPPDSPKATIRQKLEAHATRSVPPCHVDLGLAFDQFDAIGQWRTVMSESTKEPGDDPPVDSSGTMLDGRKFADAEQFKHLLLDDRDRFLQAFVEHCAPTVSGACDCG